MRYLYYRIYKVLTKVKTNDTPALNAMLLLIILEASNVLSVFMIFNFFYKLEFFKQKIFFGGVFLFIILFIPNYYFLFNKRKEIIKSYQNEPKAKKLRGIIYLLLYIVISISVFFILGESIVQKHY